MKIKLISPKMSLRPMDSEFKRLMAPSLGLLVLAALTPEPHEVYIEDENVQEINFNDTPDFVGITVNIDTAYKAFNIAEKYLTRNIPVILGGIYTGVNPDEALKHCSSICIGEAEELWPQILADVQNGGLKQKYYNENPTRMESVPIPRWQILDRNQYLYTNVICSSRGCPFQCQFCYNSCTYVHNVYRNRPIKNVINEIKSLNSQHIMFIDDNFIGNPEWTKAFLKEIKPMKLKWNAAVSTNLINHLDLLDDMQHSGCQSLFIGFETINHNSLSSVSKLQNNVNTYENLITEIHKRDIMINASIVFGFDNDTPDVFQSTLNWLIKNKIETVTAHILTPYPGTKLYQSLLKQDRIKDFDLSHYNTSNVVFEPKNLTSKQLYNGYIKLYKDFYSHKNILKRLPKSKKQWASYLLFNLGYRKYGTITSQIAKFFTMSSYGKLASKLAYGANLNRTNKPSNTTTLGVGSNACT